MANISETTNLMNEIIQLTKKVLRERVAVVSSEGDIHPDYISLMNKRDILAEMLVGNPDLKKDQSVTEILEDFHGTNELLGAVLKEKYREVKRNIEKIGHSKKIRSAYGDLNSHQPNPLFFDDQS